MQKPILEDKKETVHNRSMYSKGCRCQVCRQARLDYQREYKLKRFGTRPKIHGDNGYRVYGCRCEICTKARADSYRRRPKRIYNAEKEKNRRTKYRLVHPEILRCKSWRARNIKVNGKPVTFYQYLEIYNSQHGKCSICNKELVPVFDGKTKRSGIAHLDHDHRTGEARGILCSMCNKGIGFLQDSMHILSNALAYLSKFKSK